MVIKIMNCSHTDEQFKQGNRQPCGQGVVILYTSFDSESECDAFMNQPQR